MRNPQNGSWAFVVMLVLAALCGCSTGEERGVLIQSVAQKASSCGWGQACTISVQVPAALAMADVALLASEGQLELGTSVQARTADDLLGAVVNTGSGVTVLRHGARCQTVWSAGPVQVGHEAWIDGELRTGASYFAESSATVAGQAVQWESIPMRTESVTAVFPTSHSVDSTISAGESVALPPGAYGSVSVEAGGSLELGESGSYYFESLTAESGSSVVAYSADVFVLDQLRLAGETVSEARWVHYGDGDVWVNSERFGMLFAPAVNVIVGSDAGYVGTFVGRQIRLRASFDAEPISVCSAALVSDGNSCTLDSCTSNGLELYQSAPLATGCVDSNGDAGICDATGFCMRLEGDGGDPTCDGVDDDGDGVVDEDYVDSPTTCGTGVCRAYCVLQCRGGEEVDCCQPYAPWGDDDNCDGLDEDCDGEVDEGYTPRPDYCGLGTCASEGELLCVNGAYSSTCEPGQPAASDAICDGIDEDCDGEVDEDYVGTPTTCGLGVCARTGLSICGEWGNESDGCEEGAPLGPDDNCNGVDEDCDGVTDDNYVATPGACGVGACVATGEWVCANGELLLSCDPRQPLASDATCDGVDDDCDGQLDEDYAGGPTSCGDGACAATGERICVNGTQVSTCEPGQPAPGDTTCDGVDDDCDRLVDEDYVDVPTSCGVGVCASVGVLHCDGVSAIDSCAPTGSWGVDDDCNGLDDDCDGEVDEGYVPVPDYCGLGRCASVGELLCVHGAYSSSCVAGHAAADDATCDGVDDDCDGQVDEDFLSVVTACGIGACASTGTTSCNGGVLRNSCQQLEPASGDATCDGMDDDCDGVTDEDYAPVQIDCGGACSGSVMTSCVEGSVRGECGPDVPVDDSDCDGVDDDCDGQVDEGYVAVPTTCGVGVCASTGVRTCLLGQLSDSCAPGGPSASPDLTCDGVDDDCSGEADEDYVAPQTSCGLGACANSGTMACVSGTPTDTCAALPPAANDSDCDGIDDDCNGFTDEDYEPAPVSCGQGACAATGVLDCVAGVVVNSCTPGTPSSSDATCDGIDDDCGGAADEDYVATGTACGVGACAATGQLACVAGELVNDCSASAAAPNDATCDGIDDDCSGEADEDYVPTATSCGEDACAAAGQLACIGGQLVDTCHEGAGAPNDATCDGVDDDCSGEADEDYVPTETTCGVGACATTGHLQCAGGQLVDDCIARVEASNDATCDGTDDDCNGEVDEDYLATATSCGIGACGSVGEAACVAGQLVDTCRAGLPAAGDATCDGVDDDCSGAADEDYVAPDTTCGVGACAATGVLSCVEGRVVNTCSAGTPAPSDTTCNGIDDDCSGTVDEDHVATATACGVGACASAGQLICAGGALENTCRAGQPAPSDATCNGIDDDCSGEADEDYVPVPTQCGVGACQATGATSCVGGVTSTVCSPLTAAPSDVSCNGVDDDCDGSADEDFTAYCDGSVAMTCSGGQLRSSECSDGNVCNGTETCSGQGSCSSGTPLPLSDGNDCTQDLCDPTSGVSHPPVVAGQSCGAQMMCDGSGHCVPEMQPPVITQGPMALTVDVGQGYEFSVTATGAGLAYQWQRFGAAIPGATAATYSHAGASFSDHGSRYRVVVSNSAGSVTSAEAELTVVDTGAPSLELAAVPSSTSLDSITITGVASDSGVGIESVTAMTPAVGAALYAVRGTSGAFSVEVPLSAGLNAITITARDRSGNQAAQTVSVTLTVSQLPRIVITTPVSGSSQLGATVDVSGVVRSSLSAADIRLTLGQRELYPTGSEGEYGFLFEDVALSVGANTLSVRAHTPLGAVTEQVVVYRQDPDSAQGKPPAVTLWGAAGVVYLTGDTHTVSGTVSAEPCLASLTVNGVAVTTIGAGSQLSFEHQLVLGLGQDTMPVAVVATDCEGRSTTLEYELVRDTTEPVITVEELSEAPEINALTSMPVTIQGTITEENLAGVSTQDRSISVMPGAGAGEWDFSFELELVRAETRTVVLEAWDHSGNRSSRTLLLRLNSSLEIEFVSPTSGASYSVYDRPLSLSVLARAAGAASTDVAFVALDGQPPVSIPISGGVIQATVDLPPEDAEHQVTVMVRSVDGVLLASRVARFTVRNRADAPLELERQVPGNGALNREANEPVSLYFNRPVEQALLEVEVLESGEGEVMAGPEAGADVTTLGDVRYERVSRQQTAVPGGIGMFPGGAGVAFYPSRDYLYGGTVFVRVTYGDVEISRSSFNVRPLPTLLRGFVSDVGFTPLAGVTVELPDSGRSVETDANGLFKFGYGDFSQAIPAGRQRLIVNPGLKDRRIGSVEHLVTGVKGRLSSLGVMRVPYLDPSQPFQYLASGDGAVSMVGGDMNLDLSNARLMFPDGAPDGVVHAQWLSIAENPYQGPPWAQPIWLYTMQPAGIAVNGEISVRMNMPMQSDSYDYIEYMPDLVLMVALDPDAMWLNVVGVGRIDKASHVVVTDRAMALERMDCLGVAIPRDGQQDVLEAYSAGELGLQELLRAVQVGG